MEREKGTKNSFLRQAIRNEEEEGTLSAYSSS